MTIEERNHELQCCEATLQSLRDVLPLVTFVHGRYGEAAIKAAIVREMGRIRFLTGDYR